MQSDDLPSLPEEELQRRLEAGRARLELMAVQLEDIRDEGRQDSAVYERIEERRVKLAAQLQGLETEAQRRAEP